MTQQNDSTNRAEDKRNRAKRLIEEALDNLTKALQEGKSQTLIAYLAAMARFHRYSFGNVLMIAAQRPNASRVAGYRTWQQLGRQVKGAEKGILIFAPMLLKNRTDESPSELVDEPDRLLRFRVVHVFDVSQTEGEPLAEQAKVNGNPAGFTGRLKTFASEAGIVVEYSHELGSAQGGSRGGRILLRHGLPPAEEFSTLVHELAHELLHQGEGALRPSKTVRETEAEAVAFVVSQAIGLDTNTASSDYIQLYAGDKETLSRSFDGLFSVSMFRDRQFRDFHVWVDLSQVSSSRRPGEGAAVHRISVQTVHVSPTRELWGLFSHVRSLRRMESCPGQRSCHGGARVTSLAFSAAKFLPRLAARTLCFSVSVSHSSPFGLTNERETST